MNTRLMTVIVLLIIFHVELLIAQNPVEKGMKAITKESIHAQLEFLSSDWTEGRETSTKGEFLAGDYIASIFKFVGLKPGIITESKHSVLSTKDGHSEYIQVDKSYFQNIPFIETLSNESTMELISKDGTSEKRYLFTEGNNYSFYPKNTSTEFTAPVVYIGYGIKNEELNMDDFRGVDIKGKVVLCFDGLPPSITDTSSAFYKKHNLKNWLQYVKYTKEKKENIIKLGALAVISIPGYKQGTPANYPFRFNSANYEGEKSLNNNLIRLSLPADSLNAAILNIDVDPVFIKEILRGTGIDLQEMQNSGYKYYKSASKELKGRYIQFKNKANTRIVRGRNIVGMIEGENPNEIVVIGAHYDHVGMYNGYIWNGADDNASGTVGVMTLAKALIESGIKPKKTIIFAAWTGEEKGLYGSTYFANKFRQKDKIILNLNFDMISRKWEKDSTGYRTTMDYTKAYSLLKELIEKTNKENNLGLTIKFNAMEKPQAGTDYTPFANKNIPIFGFAAAFTKDYHQYTDHSDKADYELMARIIKVAFGAIYEITANDIKIESVK